MSSLLSAPGSWAAITPNDSTILPAFRGIYVGGVGNIVVDFGLGNLTVAVPAGTVLPMLGVQKVLATGTTATSIFGIS